MPRDEVLRVGMTTTLRWRRGIVPLEAGQPQGVG